MVKIIQILFLLLIGLFHMFGCREKISKQSGEIIEIPVTFKGGFGPFNSDYGGLSQEYLLTDTSSIWKNTAQPLTGIPQWTNIVRSIVWLDSHQFIYQNFIESNIDTGSYLALQRTWNWTPDESRLSKIPIRCYVYVVSGLDKSGKMAVVIDTNNNLDFNDEVPFYPETVTMNDLLRHYKVAHEIEYDIYRKGQVVKAKIPMTIKYRPTDPHPIKLFYSFPRYATATIIRGKEQKEISINLGFTSPAGNEVSEIVLTNQNPTSKPINLGDGIRIGEFLDINFSGESCKYQNLGFDQYNSVLRLLDGPVKEDVFSTQPGHKFPPIAEREFSNGKVIDLNNYREKYVFLEFWGTWCKPCIEELPQLRTLYEDLDRNRVEFIGIVGAENPERLARFIERTPTPSPQILSDTANRLTEKYRIEMYPSSFLISPDGIVVEKNLTTKELRATLTRLGCLKKL